VRARASRTVWFVAMLLLLGVAGLSCGEVKTGPNVPVSIEFPPPQLPSMVVGDQLHDTLGNIDSLRAIVFNSSGDTIHDAPIRYVHADTTHIVDIDSITGHVTASDTGLARVVAQTTALQSPPDTLFVVQRPTAFNRITPAEDTLTFTSVVTDTLFPLSVSVAAGSAPLNRWRVEYQFIYPAGLNTPDTTQVLLTDDNRKFSLVDTTGTGTQGAGIATRFLRISPFAHTFDDTVVVESRAFFPDHTVLPGSPLRFKVHVHIP
jgi:hypothetical protein